MYVHVSACVRACMSMYIQVFYLSQLLLLFHTIVYESKQIQIPSTQKNQTTQEERRESEEKCEKPNKTSRKHEEEPSTAQNHPYPAYTVRT